MTFWKRPEMIDAACDVKAAFDYDVYDSAYCCDSLVRLDGRPMCNACCAPSWRL